MILFHSNLYVADELSSEKRQVIKKLKQGKLQMGVHVIAISQGVQDMLEIFPSYVLLQKYYKQVDVQVVGLAGDYESALGLVEQMTNDCLKTRGDVDVRAYFMDNRKEM